jgi:integrase
MPKLRNTVPRYRKHKASGQAIVNLNGQDFYLGPHGTRASKREYDRLIGEWLTGGRQQRVTSDEGLTITEAMAAYWRHVKAYYVKNKKPTPEQACIRCTLRFVKELYADLPAAEFSPRSLKTVRSRMVDAGLARLTVNQNVGRIRRMFRWLAAEQLVSPAIYQSLVVVDGLRRGRTIARETDPISPVDKKTVDATLPCLSDVVADMVRLQRFTGMRPNEVCILRPCDLDRSADVWQYTPAGHKTEHHGIRRLIFVGPKAQAVLLRYLARAGESFCFSPTDSEAKRLAARHEARTVPISQGNRPGSNRKRKPARPAGARYNVDSYRRAIHRACDKAFEAPEDVAADRAKMKEWRSTHRWSPNQLRHSAATEIRRRFGLEAAQVVLGHAAADVTQIYAERDLTLAARVAREVG